MAITVRTNLPINVLLKITLLLLVLLQLGECSSNQFKEVKISDEHREMNVKVDNSNASCELIFQDYLNMIDNFTHCELNNARPFRLCLSCTEQFEVAKAIYANLTNEPRHIDCRIKYMQSDKVQVIPTVQTNMETIWDKAHCQNCYSYDPNGLESGTVNYRADVSEFLELYDNFSSCINTTVQKDVNDVWTSDGNISSKCTLCSKSYSLLNGHYNTMYGDDSGDVCMDVMDRMNSTRMLWSLHLKCTNRNGDHDSLPVIVISCVVACTPILFYVSLRVTGKVGLKKIFRQKRLKESPCISSDSHSTSDSSHGAEGDTGASKRRHTTTD